MTGDIPGKHLSSSCTEIKEHVYGLRNAGWTWWEFLSNGFTDIGLMQIYNDQCAFFQDDVIILIYVDDCVWDLVKWQTEDNKNDGRLEEKICYHIWWKHVRVS